MSEEQMREEFEAWWSATMNTQEMDLHRCEFPMTRNEDQPYACHETNRAWMAWQASRKALAVELPDSEFYSDGEDAYGYKQTIEAYPAYELREALLKSGITVKP